LIENFRFSFETLSINLKKHDEILVPIEELDIELKYSHAIDCFCVGIKDSATKEFAE